MKRLVATIIAALLLLGCNFEFNSGDDSKAVISDPGPEEERGEAFQFAQQFLGRLDIGEEVDSVVAPFVKDALPGPLLATTFSGLRSWTGPLESREAIGLGCTEKLPDAPAGRYFVIVFQSTFANGTIEEKVVVSFDETGYQIAGYFQTKRMSLSGKPKDAA
jgi:hypothetical protein